MLDTLSVLLLLGVLLLEHVKVLGSEGEGEEVCQLVVLVLALGVDQDDEEVWCCKLQKGTEKLARFGFLLVQCYTLTHTHVCLL